MRRSHWLILLAVVALVVGSVVAVLTADGEEQPSSTLTTKVDGADRDRKRDDELTVSRETLSAVKRSEVGRHEGQRDETPVIAPESELIAARRQQDRIRRTQDPLPVAGATSNVPGCRTRFVRNQSGRGGVRPQQQWLHYTVSPNRPGWGDVNAIVAYFNGGSGASSHFVIDAEGHCAYIVPLEHKSWTQAAANPIAISYEIINSGREGRLMDPAGYARLASVARWVARRTGIPLRRGIVRGCTSARSGVVHHKDGGQCAGGHVDITPYSIDATVRLIAAGSVRTSHLTKVERRVSDKRCYHRREHLAGRKRAANLKWARHYKRRVREQMSVIDAAKRRDGKPWKFRHRGSRRKELAGKFTGKRC